MTNVGFATLSVIPSFNGFQSKLERGTTGLLGAAGTRGGVLFGDNAGKSAGSRFGRVFSTAAKASLIGIAGAGALAVKFGGDAVSAASDQTESVNAVNVAYGKQARAVQKLGRQSAKSLALPRTEFNELAVRFSNFASTIAGGNGKKTVKALDNLTKRGADFASVYNLDVAEAATLFQSGLAGETEPLRRFGIDMSAATVEAFAFSHGIAEQGSKLTEAQKVQARYQILMEQTAKTQGDLANTSGSLANQQRFLNARWDDAKAKLGKALLPIVQDFTGFLLDEGIPAVEDFSDWFNKEGVPAIKDLGKKLGPLADELLPAAADGFKSIKGFAQDALPFAEGIVGAFNDMPGWVKKVLIGGTAGGALAVKIGLPKLLGDTLFKRGSTPANPLYVIDLAGGDTSKLPKSSLAAFAKGGLLAAFGIEAIVASKIDANNFKQGIIGSQGGHGTPFGGPEPTVPIEPKTWQEVFGTTKDLNAELDKTRNKILASKQGIEEFGSSMRERIPRTIPFDMPGVRNSQQDTRDLIALLLEARSLHMDSRLDGSTTSGPTSGGGGGGGGKGGSGTASRGVAVIINGDVRPNDSREFFSTIQRRSISSAQDGW